MKSLFKFGGKALTPTLVIDKNGKLTTVHKKSEKQSPAVPEVLAAAPPTIAPSIDTFALPQLAPLHNSDMTEFCMSGKQGVTITQSSVEMLPWSLRPVPKYFEDERILSRLQVASLIRKSARLVGSRVDGADTIIRNTFTLINYVQKHSTTPFTVLGDRDEEEYLMNFAPAVIGLGAGRNAELFVHSDLTSDQQIIESAAICSYVAKLASLSGQKSRAMRSGPAIVRHGIGPGFHQSMNPWIEQYVMEYPERAHDIASMVHEFGLGTSEEDAELVASYFTSQEKVPAVQGGWL